MANLIETARGVANLSSLLNALHVAGLELTLSGRRPFTLFAPTDTAFKKLPRGVFEVLMEDAPTLMGVLMHHTMVGITTVNDLIQQPEIQTLHGCRLNIDAMDEVRINRARVLQADILASNGVIHVIDSVLLPQTRREVEVVGYSMSSRIRETSLLL